MCEINMLGYERNDNKIGLRNYLAIIPTVFCVNEVAEVVASQIPNSKPLLHTHGCCELKPDLERTTNILCGLINNPNVGGCLIISLGCEGVNNEELIQTANRAGKSSYCVILQKAGGMTKCVEACLEKIPEIQSQINASKRKKIELSDIVLGIKCGSSDATSGFAANPAVGSAVDILIAHEGSAIFGETTELIGAEHLLVNRCANNETRDSLVNIVKRMEEKIKRTGVDMRGSQPTPGNIYGGLTTIEEKSLGAISKSGTTQIQGVLEYGQTLLGHGLYVMDSPGKENEIMTGLASGGVNIIVFSTGGGAPQGFPIVPVIKVASNPQKTIIMKEHVDIDASTIINGVESVENVGRKIFTEICAVASGKKTKAELLGYDKTIGIYVDGPSI